MILEPVARGFGFSVIPPNGRSPSVASGPSNFFASASVKGASSDIRSIDMFHNESPLDLFHSQSHDVSTR